MYAYINTLLSNLIGTYIIYNLFLNKHLVYTLQNEVIQWFRR